MWEINHNLKGAKCHPVVTLILCPVHLFPEDQPQAQAHETPPCTALYLSVSSPSSLSLYLPGNSDLQEGLPVSALEVERAAGVAVARADGAGRVRADGGVVHVHGVVLDALLVRDDGAVAGVPGINGRVVGGSETDGGLQLKGLNVAKAAKGTCVPKFLPAGWCRGSVVAILCYGCLEFQLTMS